MPTALQNTAGVKRDRNLSEEMELVDEFSEMFLGGQNVDTTAHVVDERRPRDDRKRRENAPPVRQCQQRRVQNAERLR